MICPICHLPSQLCAVAAKVTRGRCELAKGSRWEHRRVGGYLVTLTTARSLISAIDDPRVAVSIYRFSSTVDLRDDAGVSWTMRIPAFLAAYTPQAPWASVGSTPLPQLPKEYRNGQAR